MINPAASDINDQDTVIGTYSVSDGHSFGFTAKPDGVHSLGLLLGTTDSLANAINNMETITGSCQDHIGNETAVAYFNGSLVPTDLNTLIDPLPGNVKLVRGLDVNDAGQILTWGISQTDGSWHYYILSPVPEPGSLGAVMLIAMFIVRRHRRH